MSKDCGCGLWVSDTLASVDDGDRPEYAMVFPDASRGYLLPLTGQQRTLILTGVPT
ncbi:hypothetical protein ACWGNA_27600 [Brucella cytisi]|uniref:hypothetical protein n=1 Tax=Brucella cytisi TaxID=407152 RepID=UPI0035D89301